MVRKISPNKGRQMRKDGTAFMSIFELLVIGTQGCIGILNGMLHFILFFYFFANVHVVFRACFYICTLGMVYAIWRYTEYIVI